MNEIIYIYELRKWNEMNKWSSQFWMQFKQLQFLSQKKKSGFNGIWTHDLRVTSAMLYQLSYEATHWEEVNCEFIHLW